MSRKKMSLGKKIILAAIVLIVIVIAVVWGFISGKLNIIHKWTDNEGVNTNINLSEDQNEIQGNEVDVNTAENIIDPKDIKLMTDSDIINILLIGSDSRVLGERDRSDSMIICSINRSTKEIRLVSLLRDMYVSIPGVGSNRINAAYAFGGKDLLDKTIENNFGIKIDGNVAVNFASFIEGITQVGDLQIELSSDEADYLNNDPDIYSSPRDLKEGVNTLTPEQVLEYARMRAVGRSDWDRVERQKKVIMTAFAKVKDLSLSEMNNLANKLLPCIATDMDNMMILNLVRLVYAAKMQISDTTRIPVDGAWDYATIDGMGVILPTISKNAKALQEYIYGSSESGK